MRVRHYIFCLKILLFGQVLAIFSEWLFQLSKPSFLDKLDAFSVAALALNSMFFAVLAGLVFVGLFALLGWLTRRISPLLSRAVDFALLFLVLFYVILLVFYRTDTTIYSALSITIYEFPAWVNYLLLAVMLLLAGWLTYKYRPSPDRAKPVSKKALVAYSGLFAALAVFSGSTMLFSYEIDTDLTAARTSHKPLPNIILMSAEGLDRKHISLYGYQRKTTPHLEQLSRSSLVYDLAFTNSGNTRGSLCSLLTGKSPLTTKVVYAPDILLAQASFQHLPGILKKLGYYNIYLGGTYHSTPYRYNLLDGFDIQNNQKTGPTPVWRKMAGMEVLFLSDFAGRMYGKAAFLASLPATNYHKIWRSWLFYTDKDFSDESRINSALKYINEISSPWFMMLHLFKSHGPKYHGVKRVYSQGKEQVKDYDDDFYDDSIISIDGFLGEIIAALKKKGKWQDTLLIFFTDHGRNGLMKEPLPLVVHLPGQAKTKRIKAPVQFLDLAPSILARLGVQPPAWMEGRDVFNGDSPEGLKKRPIYSFMVNAGQQHEELGFIKKNLGPPYYGIGVAQIIKEPGLLQYYLPQRRAALLRPPKSTASGEQRKAVQQDLQSDLLGYMRQKGLSQLQP